jgi:hypothetical protein
MLTRISESLHLGEPFHHCYVITGFKQAINRFIAFLNTCMQCILTLASHNINTDEETAVQMSLQQDH